MSPRSRDRFPRIPRCLRIFTSDNGLFHGEHRFASSKGMPYEESIRVPLVIRGPGIPAGATSSELAINADLAPTIVQVSGAKPGLQMDGRSLLPFARNPNLKLRRQLVIESRAFKGMTRFFGIRTDHYLYVRYRNREKELYDLRKDPFELQNVHGTTRYRQAERLLATRFRQLRDCSGQSCR